MQFNNQPVPVAGFTTRGLYFSDTMKWEADHPEMGDGRHVLDTNTEVTIVWSMNGHVFAKTNDRESPRFTYAPAEAFRQGNVWEEIPVDRGRVIGIMVDITGGDSMMERFPGGDGIPRQGNLGPLYPIDLCSSVRNGVNLDGWAGRTGILWISSRRQPGEGWWLVRSVDADGRLINRHGDAYGIGTGAVDVLSVNGMLNKPLWLKMGEVPE